MSIETITAMDALYAPEIEAATSNIINKDPKNLKDTIERLEELRKQTHTIGPLTLFANRDLDRHIQSYLDKTNPLQQLYSQ